MNLHGFAFPWLIALSSLGGCVVEEHPAPRAWTVSGGGEPAATTTPPSDPSTPSTSNAPMLVQVDTGQTMNAAGGEGVGVFVEYFKGGHWHLWWSCDTNRTSQSCNFDVHATVSAGSISNIDNGELNGGVATPTSTSSVDVTSTTSTDVHGVRFDTAPGAIITVEASVGGLKDGSFLFFVQDGKVNGGFSGQLTNPLQLQGTSP
jgi:hypothetical protein